MRIPEQLHVQVSCDDEDDLSGLIVQLIVSTGQKNPYRIYFPKTDRSGAATLTRDDFVGQFKDHWEAGLMDHAGTPETAQPIVRVGLYDPLPAINNPKGSLAWPLMKHERAKWPSREAEYAYRTSTRNTDFIASPIEVNVEETAHIQLSVTRKRTGE